MAKRNADDATVYRSDPPAVKTRRPLFLPFLLLTGAFGLTLAPQPAILVGG
jgi:hypothetical protein